jgi:PleD family two-component response regulator
MYSLLLSVNKEVVNDSIQAFRACRSKARSNIRTLFHFVEATGTEDIFVLVVDDERLIADTLVAILKAKGFSAFAAYDGSKDWRLHESCGRQ